MAANLALIDKPELKANFPQTEFLELRHKFRAFVAGYGSGKTYVGGMAMCSHFREHPQVSAGYFAPSYPMIRDIFYPTIEEVAYNFGFKVKINQGNKEVHFFIGRWYYGTTICRSMDDPGKIIGFKIGHALIDEFDTLPLTKALLVWKRVIARMRFKIPGLKNGIDVTTTPEGFLATHKLFVEDVIAKPELAVNYGLIQASTYDNEINLPDDYIPSMIESYTPELSLAYVKGQFVNLKSGTVYYCYNRKTHDSTETVSPNGEVLFIGMDFNVQKMAAKIFVKRSDAYHCVAELKDGFDTPSMIIAIKEKWGDRFRKIIYPDSSGAGRSSTNASTSDIKLLGGAGFEVRAKPSNPFIKDRVNAVNVAFSKAKIKVNARLCPTTVSELEKQAYDANGMPDKASGFDHGNDAFGYFIAYEMPVAHSNAQSRTYGT